MFKATHAITHNGQVEQVMFEPSDDNPRAGVFYTRDEWEAWSSPDWALDPERGLLFQGQVPLGESSFKKLLPWP